MNIKSLVGFELKSLFVEHLLNDDVYYLTLQGSGYLDIRDNNDQWIRIEVVKGDMIGIKKNSFRRFTVDHNVSTILISIIKIALQKYFCFRKNTREKCI